MAHIVNVDFHTRMATVHRDRVALASCRSREKAPGNVYWTELMAPQKR